MEISPELARSWVDVLTQGKGLLITAGIIIMLAGMTVSNIVFLIFAFRLGAWAYFKKLVVGLERQNDINEKMVEICIEHGKEIKP